jgi:hypothetical protein
MRSEEIFALRMRKAINKGFFSEMKEAEGENALIIHHSEFAISDENESGCNCIPDLTASLKGKTFWIDADGIVSKFDQVVN